MKKLLQKILKILAQATLKKYKPFIIGIGGSVGKTATKEACYFVLRNKFKVRRNLKSYNNEIGVPLSILGYETGGRNIFLWLKVFLGSLKQILFRNKDYPRILILEMGADKPGDMSYLIKIAPCQIGILTAIAPVHLEFFLTMENIVKEESQIITHLKKDGYAVLNCDDHFVYEVKDKTKAKVITYGFNKEAEVRASDLNFILEGDKIRGINFKLNYKGNIVPLSLANVVGKQQVYCVLAGVAIGIIFGLNLIEIAEALKDYKSPPGRMNILEGIKQTLIIDDTYNSSPLAAKAALDVLKEIPCYGKRYAILGDMLELGGYTEEGHREVGGKAFECADYLITVGEKARDIARGAKEAGMSEERIFSFSNNEEAGRFVQTRIKRGDVILIKGSQGMRMEKIVKELMAEPEKAKELLVRQEETWLRKK